MEKHITLPLTEKLAKTLHAGDTVYLTGTIYTSRDAGHKRMCEALARGEKLPFDPTDATWMNSIWSHTLSLLIYILLIGYFIKASMKKNKA